MRRFETVSALLSQTAVSLWCHKLRSFLTIDGCDNGKILVPISSLKRDFSPTAEAQSLRRLNSIVYQPVSVKLWRQARQEVTRTLGRIHNFYPRMPARRVSTRSRR